MLRSGGRWILTSAAVVAATPAWHLGVLTLASVKPHRCGVSTSKRFVIVVPAHNESESIGATLASLRELDYPADRFRIVVVADNCTDDTADVVRAAGVDVLERVDPDRRGKGYALDYAFQRVADGNDAVVVIDADTDVDRRFLTGWPSTSSRAPSRSKPTTASAIRRRRGELDCSTSRSRASTRSRAAVAKHSAARSACTATAWSSRPTCCARCPTAPPRWWKTSSTG